VTPGSTRRATSLQSLLGPMRTWQTNLSMLEEPPSLTPRVAGAWPAAHLADWPRAGSVREPGGTRPWPSLCHSVPVSLQCPVPPANGIALIPIMSSPGAHRAHRDVRQWGWGDELTGKAGARPRRSLVLRAGKGYGDLLFLQ